MKIKSLLRSRWFYPIIGLLVGITLSAVISLNQTADYVYKQIQLRTTDLVIRTAGSIGADPRIAIIRIDDKTLSAAGYGQRLDDLDRGIYGQLVERLDQAGVRAIAFNLLFLGASEGDAEFAHALEAASAPAIFGVGALNRDELVQPVEELAAVADYLGHANVLSDQDYVVRRIDSTLLNHDESIAPLGVAAAMTYWRLPLDETFSESLRQGQLVNGVSLPTDPAGNLLVNFVSPGAFLSCELSDYLAATEPTCTDEHLRDKIVFVGWALANGNDYHMTPMGAMNGVEVHANLANSLLKDSLLRELPFAVSLTNVILAGLFIGLLFATKKNRIIVVIELSIVFSILALGIMLFQRWDIRFDIAGPILAMIFTHGALLTIQNMTNRKEKQIVLQLFRNQASPQVVNILLDAAENGTLKLGGEERATTIVFFDMRSFTRISELLAPSEVVEVINTYISIITTSLIECGGTLTNNAGDQVMALFNAPVDMPNHVPRAVRAAQITMDKIEAFNRTSDADQLPVKAHFGAGVETGHVIAGNIGGTEHYSYTAIGDAVNVAARLCSLAPPSTVYVGGVAVGMLDETKRENLALVGGHSVKGREGKVQIYQSSHSQRANASVEHVPSKQWPLQRKGTPLLHQSGRS